jgi:8-oxo-dGTP diphosphatase
MKHLQVVAAIIVKDEKILCVQRPQHKFDYLSYKYEFPGGKIEEGESRKNALIREIQEELGIHIAVSGEFIEVYHEYPDFVITMSGLMCTTVADELTMTEHVDFKWVSKENLHELDWAAADVPIVDKLMRTNL